MQIKAKKLFSIKILIKLTVHNPGAQPLIMTNDKYSNVRYERKFKFEKWNAFGEFRCW